MSASRTCLSAERQQDEKNLKAHDQERLVRLATTNTTLAEQKGWVLYLEGATDLGNFAGFCQSGLNILLWRILVEDAAFLQIHRCGIEPATKLRDEHFYVLA